MIARFWCSVALMFAGCNTLGYHTSDHVTIKPADRVPQVGMSEVEVRTLLDDSNYSEIIGGGGFAASEVIYPSAGYSIEYDASRHVTKVRAFRSPDRIPRDP